VTPPREPPVAGIPAGFVRAAGLAEVADGALRGVEVAGRRVCLARADGEVTALADECTHSAFPLSAGDLLRDGTVQCAWHGARFDRRTGAVSQGPACEPVASYPVLVVDDVVYVRVTS
jgi:3-phenylpropionate/trans-cinnamate dioxygenase ferredoxin component